MSEAPRFRPASLLAVLNRHQVRYVIVGGLAARVHGSVVTTGDVDICPADESDNVEQLVVALEELAACVYADEATPALPMPADAAFVRGQAVLNTLTRYGRLDLVWQPQGTGGFPELDANAVTYELLGERARVASIDDMIAAKAASGRDKDQRVLAELRFIRDRGGQ
jgi:predicted nucleotidyltransferase